jgi:hypothetical protein
MTINPYQPPETNAAPQVPRTEWPQGRIGFIATFLGIAVLLALGLLARRYDFALGDWSKVYLAAYLVLTGILCGSCSFRAAFGGLLGGWLGMCVCLLPVFALENLDPLGVILAPVGLLMVYGTFFIPSAAFGLWIWRRSIDGQGQLVKKTIRRLRPMSNDVSFLNEEAQIDEP